MATSEADASFPSAPVEPGVLLAQLASKNRADERGESS
jgi:hypothetical protein